MDKLSVEEEIIMLKPLI